MKKGQLLDILNKKIQEFKDKSYSELLNIANKVETKEFGDNENFYQIEIQVFFDDKKEKQNLRVMISIDDGSLMRSIVPLTESFIRTPSGNIL